MQKRGELWSNSRRCVWINSKRHQGSGNIESGSGNIESRIWEYSVIEAMPMTEV